MRTTVTLLTLTLSLFVISQSEGSDALPPRGSTLGMSLATSAVVKGKSPQWTTTMGYLKASNTDASDGFGKSVALSADGRTLVVSANCESSNAKGVNGNQSDNSATASGAVYVFVRTDTTWIQQAYLKASNTDTYDSFGNCVSLSADGNTLAVGSIEEASNAKGVDGNQRDNSAFRSGAVYVFTRANMKWTQQAYIKATNTESSDHFGGTLALSSDGNTLAVGAKGEDSSASRINGNQNDNSAKDSGAAYVFVRSGTAWTQQAYIKASNANTGDNFGVSVALGANGTFLAVGAHMEDGNSKGINGNESDDSVRDSGAVYLFTRQDTDWKQQTYLKASNPDGCDYFGGSLAISADGRTLAVGALGEGSNTTIINGNQNSNCFDQAGAVYIFVKGPSNWTQQAYIKASNTGFFDYFSKSIALSADGNTLAVGAPFECSNSKMINGDQNDDSLAQAGAEYVYTRVGTTWTQSAYIKASNTGYSDRFGQSCSLSHDGKVLAVGAYCESSNAKGINGNQNNDRNIHAGAVYLYK